MIYDCAIIGGGPSGLNAALVLSRARRSVALFDNNQPRNAVTHASYGQTDLGDWCKGDDNTITTGCRSHW